MIRELFALFPPVKRGRDIAAIEFNEVHLPRRLSSFAANLSTISGTLRPVQEMISAVSEEIARGEADPQPFHPYIVPNYMERPWLPRPTAHVNALMAWKAENRGTRKQGIAFQMWMRRHYRLVFAAKMCNDWATLWGGLAAQLNHIAVFLSIDTTESAAYAISYHNPLASTLADYARARFPFDYHTALSDVHEDTRRSILRDTAPPPFRPNAPLPSEPN